MIDVEIKGEPEIDGEVYRAGVGTHGHLRVEMHDGDPPPRGQNNRLRYFSQLMSAVGDGTGTTNMNVNGAPTSFFVKANKDYDIRLMKLVIRIQDSAVVHSNFGNVAALGTGWDLKVIEASETQFIIEKAKTSGEVIIQSATALAWGDGALSFELTNINSTEDATVVVVNLHEAVPGGLRIGRGTEDQLESVVNDDLTGLTQFTVRGIGYKHFP